MLTIILENMKLHYQLLCKNMFFLDSIYYLGRRKQAIKNRIIAIIIQTKDTKWKIVVLEKFRTKNHQIWSSYKGEIVLTNFNSGLKREM